VVAEQIDVGVIGRSGDPFAVGQGGGQAVLGHHLEQGGQAGFVVEVGVQQHPGDLGQQQHLVVGGDRDRLAVLAQTSAGPGVGVGQQLVEHVHQPVDHPDQALRPKASNAG